MPKIHPTAIVHPKAQLADDVEVGPYCIVEQDVTIGSGTVLRQHVIVRRYTTMGSGNFVDSFVVLGGEPQDFGFDAASKTFLRIGDQNVFREGVTVSRATGEGKTTTVGSRTYWMTHSHAGHNATIEDGVILANGAAVAGHAVIGRKAILSACALVHQFCWVGEMVMTQGHAGASMHIPPFCLLANINNVVALNTVGLRRAKDITEEDRRQIHEAFHLLYRSGLPTSKALEKMNEHPEWGAAASRFREFIRKALAAEKPFRRGICPMVRRERERG